MNKDFICPLCKKSMNQNYCPRCGVLIDNNNQIVTIQEKIHNHSLETFIGENYSKIMRKNNYAAGILGPLYLVYRKCYFFGIVLCYFEIFMIIILKNIVDFRGYFLLKLLSYLFYYSGANAIYLYIANKKN